MIGMISDISSFSVLIARAVPSGLIKSCERPQSGGQYQPVNTSDTDSTSIRFIFCRRRKNALVTSSFSCRRVGAYW